MPLRVVSEAAGLGVLEGKGERGEGSVVADGVEKEWDGGGVAAGGGLGQVLDGGLEDVKVTVEGRVGGRRVLLREGLVEEGLEPEGVEAFGMESVTEGVDVAWLAAGSTTSFRVLGNRGWIRFLERTNRKRISHS